mmetsp:Transcript_103484/g.221263  ORF Transcript_103484/g.221263 Transcript_103484/m.221263 type:complete len:216 (+) Transcript_103484:920-1567(+)
MMPFSLARSTIFFPSVVSWYSVSVNKMAPPQNSPRPLVPSSVSRQRLRFISVFSTPMDSRRIPQVPFDSSIAKIPFPGIVSAFAVATSSSLYSAQCTPVTEARVAVLNLWAILLPAAPYRAPIATTATSVNRAADAIIESSTCERPSASTCICAWPNIDPRNALLVSGDEDLTGETKTGAAVQRNAMTETIPIRLPLLQFLPVEAEAHTMALVLG